MAHILPTPEGGETPLSAAEERIRCNAPAIRFLMREGAYPQRYSCRLRAVIAQTLAQPPIACTDG